MGHVKSIKENDFGAIHESSKFLVTPGNIISGEHGWLSLLSGTYGWDDPYEEMGETLQSRWTGYFYDTNYFRPNVTVGRKNSLKKINHVLMRAIYLWNFPP